MSIGKRIALGTFWFLSIFLAVAPTWAEETVPFQVIKVSPQDHRAVVKMNNGVLKVVGVGDVLGQGSKVIEVSAQRLVLEAVTPEGMVTTIVRLDGARQQVETIRQQGGLPPRLVVPVR